MAEVPNGTRIFGSNLLYERKRTKEGLKRKSRLVSQGYNDHKAIAIATKALKMKGNSQITFMALEIYIPGTRMFGRDVTEAYIQSRSVLERNVFIKAPSEKGLLPETALRVDKSLYGMQKAGLNWYLTYLSHHIDELGVKKSRIDHCVPLKRQNGQLTGDVPLQVYNSRKFGKVTLLIKEDK